MREQAPLHESGGKPPHSILTSLFYKTLLILKESSGIMLETEDIILLNY